jgi:hypothetical protein
MPRGQTGRGDGGDSSADKFYTDEGTGLNAYTFADRVKTRLGEMGIGRSNKPILAEEHKGVFPGLEPGDVFNGQLPVVVRRLSLDQLSALYSLFTSWYSYVSSMTNIIAVERSEAKRQKEFLWSHIRRQYKVDVDGKKISDQACSDLARGDYRFVVADAKYEELNVLYNCMNASLEVTEADMKMISREVTIVQAKLEKDAQGSGFGSRVGGRAWRGNNEANDQETTPPDNRPVKSYKAGSKGRVRISR